MKKNITVLLGVFALNSVALGQANYINPTGNVGIATTSPSARLEVNSDGTNPGILVSGTSGNYKDYRTLNTTTGVMWQWSHRAVTYEPENFEAYFNNGSSWRRVLALTPAGSLGLGGITTPLSRFQMDGDNAANAKLLIRGDNGIDPSVELGSTETGNNTEWGEGLVIKYSNNVGESIFNNIYTLGTSAFRFQSGGTDRFNIQTGGNVGIGTSTPGEKLSVNGTIRSKEVKVEITGWPDYVFDRSYKLPSLAEVKKYVKVNNHLPGIPSAEEVSKDGVSLGEMNAKLLKKIEELTLYLIDLKSEVDQLKKQVKK